MPKYQLNPFFWCSCSGSWTSAWFFCSASFTWCQRISGRFPLTELSSPHPATGRKYLLGIGAGTSEHHYLGVAVRRCSIAAALLCDEARMGSGFVWRSGARCSQADSCVRFRRIPWFIWRERQPGPARYSCCSASGIAGISQLNSHSDYSQTAAWCAGSGETLTGEASSFLSAAWKGGSRNATHAALHFFAVLVWSIFPNTPSSCFWSDSSGGLIHQIRLPGGHCLTAATAHVIGAAASSAPLQDWSRETSGGLWTEPSAP